MIIITFENSVVICSLLCEEITAKMKERKDVRGWYFVPVETGIHYRSHAEFKRDDSTR